MHANHQVSISLSDGHQKPIDISRRNTYEAPQAASPLAAFIIVVMVHPRMTPGAHQECQGTSAGTSETGREPFCLGLPRSIGLEPNSPVVLQERIHPTLRTNSGNEVVGPDTGFPDNLTPRIRAGEKRHS